MASEKITAIVDSIAELTVLELKELKETIEETFGVTAAAVAVAAGPAAGAAPAAEEQTEFTVTLESFDAAKKIPVIKAVREITGLGLGEAKALVEGAPKPLKEGVSKADADEIVKKIEEAGGKASKK